MSDGPPPEGRAIRLQPLARAKVGSLGIDGQAWLSRLPATLTALEQQWQLSLRRPLPGGSAAYVVGAVCADGSPAVVHGDPHPGNLLRIRVPRPGAETGFCFVDPDGFVADRAYDLGVAVRAWTEQLKGSDAERTLRRYCTRLSERSGVDAERIWEWGFVERVSTGLYLKSFGADGLAERYLTSAEALVC